MYMNRKTIVAVVALLLIGCFESQAAQALNLQQCIEMARQHNRSLQNAMLEMERSAEQKKEARSKYLPEISANAIAFQAFDKIIKADGTYPEELAALESINPAFSQLAGQPYAFHELSRGYTATVSLMLPLYTGGQIYNSNKLAEIGNEVAQLQYAMQEKEVVQKVTENYWQIANLTYNLQTIDAAEVQLKAIYEQVNNFIETGVTTGNALLKVKLRQQELASNRLQLENAIHVLTLLLAQQIGMGSEPLELQIADMNSYADMPAPVPGAEAVLGREELQLADKMIASDRLQVKMERGKNLPKVAIGVVGYQMGIGGVSEPVKSYINTSATNAIGLVTLSVPISSWIGGSHAVKRARIKQQQSQNSRQDIETQLIIDIESAWSNLQEAYQQIKIAQASVEEAKENFRMSSDQYNIGKETLTDLLDAETLNRQACNSLSSAIAIYNIRYADYQRKVR